jgi:ppGpp synthetase/RelA/SpoT-type nucleotidyltranferase
LKTIEDFREHPWVIALLRQYSERDAILAEVALFKIVDDVKALSLASFELHGRAAFTDVHGRVKTAESLVKKLFKLATKRADSLGLTSETLQQMYGSVKDVCGIRISCPYVDQVRPAVSELIRPRLKELGYVTVIDGEGYPDKDYLEDGDVAGYRSYHFYVMVPTPIDIFGNVEYMCCEIQVRSELQHVWADKSHALLYKRSEGRDIADPVVQSDMREISNLLYSVDKLLINVRDRIQGGGNHG